MLSLTRIEGEKIQIGDDITIHFEKINNRRCTVRIEAPDDVRILRSEILDRYERKQNS